MLVLIKCTVIGVVRGFFLPRSERSSLARTRDISFWSSKFELNQYALTAAEGTVISYLLAQGYHCLNSPYSGIFLKSLYLEVFIIFLGVNTNIVILLTAAVGGDDSSEAGGSPPA